MTIKITIDKGRVPVKVWTEDIEEIGRASCRERVWR